jgi:hypothetical protein
VYAIRSPRPPIKVHERRDQAREATEHPWDKDTAEKPDIVMFEAVPDVTQPGRAKPAADEADDKSVNLTPHVSLK